jgi:hypothetical protein
MRRGPSPRCRGTSRGERSREGCSTSQRNLAMGMPFFYKPEAKIDGD